MQKYEYHIQLQSYAPETKGIDQDIHNLNLLGDEGWELISVSDPIRSGEAHGVAWHYFFRRPLAPGQKSRVLERGLPK